MAEEKVVMKPLMEARSPEVFVRFSAKQRVEHLLVMTLFSGLLLTGLPQKYFQSGWGEWLIINMGGIGALRMVHRIMGIALTVVAGSHLGVMIYGFMSGKSPASILPTRKDFSDAVLMLRYCLGLTPEQPLFDRFDYRQKFEYWGLVFGGLIMMSTGFILYFPTIATLFMPGQAIPAAKVAHSQEALLAFLVVIIWHMYGAHFHPGAFPFDSSIFTGKIDKERMIEEHPLEFARIMGIEPEELERSGDAKKVLDAYEKKELRTS